MFSKKGWQIVAELAEDVAGASSAKFYLPQLEIIFKMAANDQFDILVVGEMDCLSRGFVKQLLIEENLLNKRRKN